MKMFIFFGAFMAKQKDFKLKKFDEYKTKIKKISRKIERWHSRATVNINGKFMNDQDFERKMHL
jgi:hypothetical protein